MSLLIREDKIDDALKILQDFLASIPQCNNTNYEGHYQQMLYVIFTLLGYYVDVEVHTEKHTITGWVIDDPRKA